MARVRMYHAGSDRYQDASSSAFEQVWKSEGWVLADDEAGEPTPEAEVTEADEPAEQAEAPEAEVTDEAPPARNGRSRR